MFHFRNIITKPFQLLVNLPYPRLPFSPPSHPLHVTHFTLFNLYPCTLHAASIASYRLCPPVLCTSHTLYPLHHTHLTPYIPHTLHQYPFYPVLYTLYSALFTSLTVLQIKHTFHKSAKGFQLSCPQIFEISKSMNK